MPGKKRKGDRPYGSLSVIGQDCHNPLEAAHPPPLTEAVAQQPPNLIHSPVNTEHASSDHAGTVHADAHQIDTNHTNGNHTNGTREDGAQDSDDQDNGTNPPVIPCLSPLCLFNPSAPSESNVDNAHQPTTEQPADEANTNGHGSTSSPPPEPGSSGDAAANPETAAPIAPGSLPAVPTIGGPSKLTVKTDPATQERRRHEVHSNKPRPRQSSGNPFGDFSGDQDEGDESQSEDEEA
jgi:hypothetical protein